ncbi:MAG: peptidylprolyl isomerase [Nitrospirae bacterium]|nr:peptidylprolyl isomerase [Nitrospirota bacterium]
MKISKFIAMFFISAVLLLPVIVRAEAAPEDSDMFKIMVTVNEGAINRGDIVIEVNKLLPLELYHRNMNPEKMKEIEDKAIESLIDRELFSQEAKRLGIKADKKEAKKIFESTRAQYPSRKGFETVLKNSGLTKDSLLMRIEKTLMVAALIKQEVTKVFSDTELEEYYKNNIDKFKQPEAVRLRHIYVQVDPSQQDAYKKAKDKIEEALAKIKAGEDFGKIAYEYSSDMSRVKGGDVGFLHKGMIPVPEMEKVAFSLEIGKMSDIMETEMGYHIIRLEEKSHERQVPFAEIKNKLEKEMKDKAEKERMDALRKRLRENAVIKRF